MDALDRLAGVGTDLLHRVDAVLVAGGAPVGDPLWPLLRRVGALPGDALEFGLRLDPGPLRAAAAQLRADADRFGQRRARLAAELGAGERAGGWEGAGAEAFAARWQALADHIGDGGDPATVSGRLRATAGYCDGLADWTGRVRHELAEAVARVVTSAEAVAIRGRPADGPPPAAVLEAAARIGVRVLQPVADAYTVAHDLMARWQPDLAELRYIEPGVMPTAGATPITRVTL